MTTRTPQQITASSEFKSATKALYDALDKMGEPNAVSDAIINWVIRQYLPSSRWYAGMIAYAVESDDPSDHVILDSVDVASLFATQKADA